ncbi:ANTAR domain-containing protein [Granulicella sp. 5B5]|uniref:uroporphyrinogen-III synthase n=1 Tax=Granulicella sp. 5B5 TaxID=1617967 RepID=UPI0015F6993A|nr:uroporphyrinogen-III synthase [Granulicella sp. 5B5]QMV19267.1 ANTAR domain-containing protein [Granulicella sp. 5B5]
MAHASFEGLRVLSLESRRAKEVEKLIRTYGGEPFVVPAMREVRLETNTAALEFSQRLIAGEIDVVVFFTGAGVRALVDVIAAAGDRDAFLKALGSVRIIARGPKPDAALKELGIKPLAVAQEPSTWHEVIGVIDRTFGEELKSLRVAVQEYGASNPELLAALSERAASVLKVPVYRWELPQNLQPLRETVHGIAQAQVDIILFTTAVQVIHLMMVAQEMNLVPDLMRGLRNIAVVSVGPTTTAELLHYGITPDFEPSRPKLGFLVNEAAQYAGQVLTQKRELAAEMGYDLLPTEKPTATALAGELATEPPEGRRPVRRVAESTPTMAGFTDGLSSFEFVHEISRRIAAADPLHGVLDHIVGFVTGMIPCDSCFIYVIEANDKSTDKSAERTAKKQADKLVLRASSNPHAELVDRLDLSVGQGITGWVAEHREPVAISAKASEDPRFKVFSNLPEDTFEAILSTPILCANKVVGVINLQHRLSYEHSESEVRLLSTIGFLVGAEIERARLESENVQLADRLETRKTVERAKGILQRDLGLTESESYLLMQKESRQRRKSMREIADALLLGEELKKLRPGLRAEE